MINMIQITFSTRLLAIMTMFSCFLPNSIGFQQLLRRYVNKLTLFDSSLNDGISSTLKSPNIIGYNVSEKILNDASQLTKSIDEVDYCIIGSGIGGLSCAALLSYYGYSTVVLESHYLPGGCAHTFERNGFKFDAGPSLWNGMNTKPYNPLREILELIGEGNTIEYKQYDGWVMHIPEGSFKFTVGEGNFEPIIEKFGGSNAIKEWKELCEAIKPLQVLAAAIPPLTVRSDPSVILTLLPHIWNLIQVAPYASKVEGNFKDISTKYIKDKFLENWFEFLSFALSGLPADSTIAAAVVYTMRDLHQSRAALDYPVGGSDAVIQGLIRGITKTGNGQVILNSHVSEILVNDKKEAYGVKLRRNGKIIKAKRAVISNASIWDTVKLLPITAITEEKRNEYLSTPRTGSFVHLHIGINATGLPKDLESHYTVINTWNDIDSPQNHVIISIPSVLDANLAPSGCHVIHAYAAANEPYELWENISSKQVYQQFKQDRCEFLWKAIERSIPDVRQRVLIDLEGSPITHERFNRRYKGTFGPAFRAGINKFPYPKFDDIDKLYICGDSRFPGIGVPAVAVSGAIAASSTVPVWKQLEMLNHLYSLSTNK